MKQTSSAVLALGVLGTATSQGSLSAQDFSHWSAFCQGVEHTASVALGDLDGDGDLDVIFANGRHFAEPDWVFSNDGRGTFYGRRVMEADPDPSYGIALGDLDGDGSLDAVVANDVGNRSVVYRNDGLGNFAAIAGLGSGTEARRAVALGDLDGDGDLDVVLVGEGQDHIYFNQGGGNSWDQHRLGSGGARGLSVAVADFDADGYLDIVVAERGPGRIVVYPNDGRGGFTESQVLGISRTGPTGVAVGDLDSDDDTDLVAVNQAQAHVTYLNDGQGVFREGHPFGAGTDQAWSVALGDIDLDGDVDAVVGAANLRSWFDDFEGDGVPDRFGDEAGAGPSRIYINDGTGKLSPDATVGTGSDATRPVVLGDVDGDGDLDIVMGNDCQPNYVFFNSLRATGPQ